MTKREHERGIFTRVISAFPLFAGEAIHDWTQPQDESEFPDVICETQSGRKIGVELGEWLNEKGIRDAKSTNRLERSILQTIGAQGNNITKNIYRVSLEPHRRSRVTPRDEDALREQFFRFIRAVDDRWQSERSWHSPQGYLAESGDFVSYPVIQRYLKSAQLWPREYPQGWPPNGRVTNKTWPTDVDWIEFDPPGGAYTEGIMIESLLELLSSKQAQYGASGTGFDGLCLIAYYNSAVLYNSPVETPFFSMEDAVRIAAQFLGGDPSPFDKIFLFVAVDGDRFWQVA